MVVVKASLFLEPLFEFSVRVRVAAKLRTGKLVTQLLVIELLLQTQPDVHPFMAQIYQQPPWTTNKDGRGPAWANSCLKIMRSLD